MTPTPCSGRKCSALDTLGTSDAKRHRSGRTGTDGMFSLAGAINNLADSFTAGDGALASPRRRQAAITLLDKDADLSENEQVQAIRLFSRHTAIADSYMSIQNKSTRTRYIQAEITDA